MASAWRPSAIPLTLSPSAGRPPTWLRRSSLLDRRQLPRRCRVSVVTAEGPYFGHFLGDRSIARDDAAGSLVHQGVDKRIPHGHGCIVAFSRHTSERSPWRS